MVAHAALCGAEREMVLDAISEEDLGIAIVAVNGNGNGDRTFGILDAVTIIDGDIEAVGHHVKLLARHVEYGMSIEVHGSDSPEHQRRTNTESHSPKIKLRILDKRFWSSLPATTCRIAAGNRACASVPGSLPRCAIGFGHVVRFTSVPYATVRLREEVAAGGLCGRLRQMKTVVVLGASRNPDRYAFRAMERLQRHGYKAIPVNPAVAEILGEQCYASIQNVPGPIDTVTIYVGSERSTPFIDEIIRVKPRRIIFNPGAENQKLAEAAKAAGIEVIRGCTLVLLQAGTFEGDGRTH